MIGADELREAWRIFTPLLDQIDNEAPQPVVHEFQTVVPDGVVELASAAGMTFNAMVRALPRAVDSLPWQSDASQELIGGCCAGERSGGWCEALVAAELLALTALALALGVVLCFDAASVASLRLQTVGLGPAYGDG